MRTGCSIRLHTKLCLHSALNVFWGSAHFTVNQTWQRVQNKAWTNSWLPRFPSRWSPSAQHSFTAMFQENRGGCSGPELEDISVVFEQPITAIQRNIIERVLWMQMAFVPMQVKETWSCTAVWPPTCQTLPSWGRYCCRILNTKPASPPPWTTPCGSTAPSVATSGCCTNVTAPGQVSPSSCNPAVHTYLPHFVLDNNGENEQQDTK